MGFEAKIFT